MNLVVDIGNSLIKYGVFENGRKLAHGGFSAVDWQENLASVRPYSIDKVLVSTVAGVPDGLLPFLETFAAPVLLDEKTPVPVLNAYTNPQTLGRDRLANACGGITLFPGEPVLVIDAGTCLKFDYVDDAATYHGGAISPGLHMRFKALHEDTVQLPLFEPVHNPSLIGRDTRGSIQSGVVNGMIAEIDGVAEQYQKMEARLKVVMTGGDADFFLYQLKSRIFAVPDLTLIGLNAILDYQHT